MEIKSGQPVKKGNKPGKAHDYYVKTLRDREKTIAENAERAYEHFVGQWQPMATQTTGSGARMPQNGKARMIRRPDGASSRGSVLRHESPTPEKYSTRKDKTLVDLIRGVDKSAHVWMKGVEGNGTVLNFVCGLGTMGRKEARRKEPKIPDAILDQLFAGADPKTAFDLNGLLDDLKKALAERALNAEMEHHLANSEARRHQRRGGAWGRCRLPNEPR